MTIPFTVRPSMGGILVLLLAACGGDNPAGPGGGDLPVESLSIASSDVRTLEIVSVGVRGVTVPATGVDGRVGPLAVRGARLDDTTVALVVPRLTAGEHEIRFEIGATAFTTRVQVTASPAVADATSYFDRVIGTVADQATAIEQRLAAAPSDTPVSDTLGLGAVARKLRVAADSARRLVDDMPAADRAGAAAFLSVNAQALGIAGGDAAIAGPDFALNPCAEKSVADCNAYLSEQWTGIKARILACTIQAGRFAAVGAVALGAVGSLFAAIGAAPGAAIGAVLGGVAGAALCVKDINERALQHMIVPAIVHLRNAVANADISYDVAPVTTYYTVKQPKTVEVTAEVRSFITTDVNLPGVTGTIARTIDESAGLWAKLMQKTGLSVTGPALPTLPAVREMRDMPASLLQIGTISLAGVTATKAGDDTSFKVTFANDKQGANHVFTYNVRYEPAGRAAEEVTLSGVLRPERYAVAQVRVDSVPEEMRVGQGTRKLYWVARDSTGSYLGATGVDSLLDGRRPGWTSSNTDVATVDAAGVVTPRAEGTVTITARLEGGMQSVSISVYPNVIGSWTLKTLNGRTVPYSEPDSTGTTVVGGGSITINADSTFGFSYAETYTNKFTGQQYDEGGSGSGTYVLKGNAITFTILQKNGDAVEEFVNAGFKDGTLTVGYSGADGSAIGELRRN